MSNDGTDIEVETKQNLSATVLVVEDESFSRQLFKMILEDDNYQYVGVETLAEARNYLEKNLPDLIVLDVQLPDGNGLEFFNWLCDQEVSVPVIIMTAFGSISDAVKAIKKGAYDFIPKPFEDTNKVRNLIKNALEHGRLKQENSLLRARLESPGVFKDILGESKAMKHVFDMVQRAARADSNILIEGGSGTGKELVGKAIHDLSNRKDDSFIPVNCGALPETLLEAALFGYEKGSFTGAQKTTKGFFEEADGGTLFLDEIGDASPPVQVKILRAVEYGEIYRVGATKPISVNVRCLFATNKDLNQEVAENRFREDLFFRINVIKITLPALEDRREDIPLLVKFFSDKFCSKAGAEKKIFSEDAISFLRNFPWKGNIRELKNFIERVVVLHPEKSVTAADLTRYNHNATGENSGNLYELDYEKARNAFEKKYFEGLLSRSGGDLNQAIEFSGVHRATIYRKIKDLDIKI
jgi:two-component system nitrogen regulation response regulator NtrX